MKHATLAIESLVPHSGSMCLLDELVSYRETGLTAKVTINSSSTFYEPSLGVPAFVGIEYMGQAIAAWAGVSARAEGRPVKIGFLVSSRKYVANIDYFPVAVELLVTVECLGDEVGGLQVFTCEIEADGVYVEAKLNVFMPEDANQFLSEASHA